MYCPYHAHPTIGCQYCGSTAAPLNAQPPSPFPQVPAPIVFNFPPAFGAMAGFRVSDEDVLRIAQATAQLLFQMLQSSLVPQPQSNAGEPDADETPIPDEEPTPPPTETDNEGDGEAAAVS